MLMEGGIRSWLDDKVREAADNEIEADQLRRKAERNQFLRAMIRFVREHPIDSTDVSKFT
jgi:hypothetical protein